jgi:hypothetical protein
MFSILNKQMDKQACAAMHAVNLRNLLGATCRTQREEQNEETDEFLDLFDNDIVYIEGARTTSGFYTVEDIEYITRMYKVTGTQRILLEPVPIHFESLDFRHVYLLDAGMNIYLWNGAKCNPITRSKARLFAEKINKHERKFQAELIQMKQGDETSSFWDLLQGPPDQEFYDKNHYNSDEIISNIKLELVNADATKDDTTSVFKPKLYKVGIGMGYLELPQVRTNTGSRLILTRSLLDSKSVYILDCFTDIFVWIGRKSTRLVRTAALKLSQSLEAMIARPSITCVTSTLEGTESQIFKSKFEGWDDLIAVDYTRTAQVVNNKNANFKRMQQQQQQGQQQNSSAREGSVDSVSSGSTLTQSIVDLRAPNSNLMRAQSEKPHAGSHVSSSVLPPLLQISKEPLRTDLVALFVDRYVPVPDEEAVGWMEEINDFLESMECFVFENKRFVRLPENEIGQFYSEDSYLFVCKYWKVDETDSKPVNPQEDSNEEDNEAQGETSIECKLYFWQGRDANNSGWLTFTFSLKKKFKDIEIIKFNQQQENPQFLSHFKRKFIIHKGKRLTNLQKQQQHQQKLNSTEQNNTIIDDAKKKYETKMYHLRKNPYSAICTRCIQLDTAKASNLCSEFCYIVCVPFENLDQDNSSTKGIVYVWIGNKSNSEEGRLAEEIARDMYDVSIFQGKIYLYRNQNSFKASLLSHECILPFLLEY